MPKGTRYTLEQIIGKLHNAEVEMSKGHSRTMTDTVMSYITVEPFEVCHEILVSGPVPKDWLEAPPTA